MNVHYTLIQFVTTTIFFIARPFQSDAQGSVRYALCLSLLLKRETHRPFVTNSVSAFRTSANVISLTFERLPTHLFRFQSHFDFFFSFSFDTRFPIRTLYNFISLIKNPSRDIVDCENYHTISIFFQTSSGFVSISFCIFLDCTKVNDCLMLSESTCYHLYFEYAKDLKHSRKNRLSVR